MLECSKKEKHERLAECLRGTFAPEFFNSQIHCRVSDVIQKLNSWLNLSCKDIF